MNDNKALDRAEIIAALRCCGPYPANRDCGNCPVAKRDTWCCSKVLTCAAELLERDVEPPNDPLTLEELREMDGEPVYIVRGRGADGWAVVGVEDGALYFHGPDFEDSQDEDFYAMKCANTTCSQPCKYGLHQLGWLAYRHKPEGGGQ